MKTLGITVLVVVLMLFAGLKGYSQTVTQKADSLQVKAQQEQTSAEADLGNSNGNAYGKINKNNGTKAVKRVRGSRPDMSRARGARPPSIVRPSGSGVPRGVGKPGGVGRKGGR